MACPNGGSFTMEASDKIIDQVGTGRLLLTSRSLFKFPLAYLTEVVTLMSAKIEMTVYCPFPYLCQTNFGAGLKEGCQHMFWSTFTDLNKFLHGSVQWNHVFSPSNTYTSLIISLMTLIILTLLCIIMKSVLRRVCVQSVIKSCE